MHLQHQLQEWLAEGEHIIVGLDMNDDARTCPTTNMFRSLGLRDLILGMHSHQTPTETNVRNSKGTPIDGLFATPGITPAKGGYMQYGQVMDSDHRTLWVDIPFTSILGYNPPNLHIPNRRPVNAKDPRSVQRFVKEVHKSMENEDCQILHNFQQLKTMRSTQPPPAPGYCHTRGPH